MRRTPVDGVGGGGGASAPRPHRYPFRGLDLDLDPIAVEGQRHRRSVLACGHFQLPPDPRMEMMMRM